MRKIVSIVLLLIFVYNPIGYVIVFKVLQNQVRHEIKQKIKQSVPDNELIIIAVPFDDDHCLMWTKPNKEFRFKGEMYDVVKIESRGNQILYFCIHDFKESKLFAEIDHHIHNHIANNPNHRKRTNYLNKKVITDYISQTLLANSYSFNSKNLPFKKYINLYHSISMEIPYPPPKIA